MAIFQLVNNIKMTLAVGLASDSTELIVLDSDLSTASQYDPTKVLSLTLIGDEELNQYEIVYATQRTGTTFTVTRGEENTSAGEWGSGTLIVAALTAGVLRDTASAPTSAINVAYEGGNFGAAGTVESTLDSMGDAIITQAAETEYYEAVQQRVSGPAFSGGTANTTNLRWQGGAKRFVTAGLGVPVTTVVTIGEPAVAPDLTLCLRCANTANWSTLKVRAYNNAAGSGTHYLEWTIPSAAIPVANAWLLSFLPASAATVVGTPSANLPDRVQVTFTDNATGVLTVDVNFLDVVAQRLSYLGAFIRINTAADFAKVDNLATYGYRASLVIKDTVLSTLNALTIRGYQFDGHRIYTTSDANFKAQTSAQIRVVLFTALRSFFAIGIIPDGWIYLNGWSGTLDLEPNVTVRQLTSIAFQRGVGVGTFRSAIEVYHFDDPLIVASSLANARTYLTGADKTAINIDLSALSAAEMGTLSGEISLSGNFYTTTLDYQNADNLKSGTVAVARLPLVPGSKGGVEAGTVVFGVMATAPSGYLLCHGGSVSSLTYPNLWLACTTKYGAGSISTTVALPDYRGCFLRVMDVGRGVDPGRAIGVLQAQMFASHGHVGSTGYVSADHAHHVSANTGGRSAYHTHSIYERAQTNLEHDTSGEGDWSVGTNFGRESSIDNGDHVHGFAAWSGGISVNHTHAVTVDAQGGSETRPINHALYAYIKY